MATKAFKRKAPTTTSRTGKPIVHERFAAKKVNRLTGKHVKA